MRGSARCQSRERGPNWSTCATATFEEAIREPRARLFADLGASAVFVRTLSGKLQLHRMERADRVYRTFLHATLEASHA